jgi:hypothetical protein
MIIRRVFSVGGVAALTVGVTAALLVSGLGGGVSPGVSGAKPASPYVVDKVLSSTAPIAHLIVLHRGW